MPNHAQSALPRLFQAQYADLDEDLPFWLSLARTQDGPVLELGCGTGRVAQALAQAGFDVLGIDNHAGMLSRARLSTPKALRTHLTFQLADMTALSLSQRFPLAISPCNTFSELTAQQAAQALAAIRAHLTPGALLALDLPNPPETLRDLPDPHEPLQSFIEPESGNPVQLYAMHEAAPDGSSITVEWSYDELFPDGTCTRHRFSTTYHMRGEEEMHRLLHQIGFKDVHLYGEYDFSPLRPGSARLLVTAFHP
jgi:SAM-dependent methyltransferase